MDKHGDEMKTQNYRGRALAERRRGIAALSLASKIIAPIVVVGGLFVILLTAQIKNWIDHKETLLESHDKLIRSNLLSLNLSRLEERSRTLLLSYRLSPSTTLLATLQRVNRDVKEPTKNRIPVYSAFLRLPG